MFAGLSLGTMTISRFFTKTSGSPFTRPSFTAVFISSSAAEAKTSAGAPCWIWASNVELDSKLCFTFTPGFCCSNRFANSPKASMSEEAARTVSVPPCCCFPSPPETPPQPAIPARATPETDNAAKSARLTLLCPLMLSPFSRHLSCRQLMLEKGCYPVFVQSARNPETVL